MLVSIAKDLWVIDHKLRLAAGFFMPVRMTVVRLGDGSLALVSPVPIDDALGAALEELGEVRHVCAPNLLHHLWLGDAKRRFGQARLYGPEGLTKKRPDLRLDATLAEANLPFAADLTPLEIVGAQKIQEHVFVHRASGTLVVTDLVFNLHAAEGWLSPWVFRMMGVWNKLAQSRAWRFATKDRGGAAESAERLLAQPFDRVVPAHGDVVESGGHAGMETALAWMTRRGASTRPLRARRA